MRARLALLCALTAAGCGGKDGTFVLVTVRGDAGGPIDKVNLTAMLGGRVSEVVTLRDAAGGVLLLPKTHSLEIVKGEGLMTVSASALDAAENQLATTQGSATVVRGQTVQLDLCFGVACTIDGGPVDAGDGGGSDGGDDGGGDDGQVGGAVLDVMPADHNFGSVVIGSSAMRTFMVMNRGGMVSGALAVTTANSEYALTSDGCTGMTLAAGAGCSVTVVFAPVAAGGVPSSLTVSATPGGTATVTLGGMGSDPATLRPDQNMIDFGSLPRNASSTATVNIANPGGVASGTLATAITGAGFTVMTDGCNASTLPAGGSCAVTVRFAAGTLDGLKTGMLTVTGSPGGTATVDLRGTTIMPSPLSISAISLASPTDVDATATATVTVTNGGGVASSTLSITFQGTHAAEFSAGTGCNTTLAAGANCMVVVTFQPTSAGPKTASLVVNASNPGNAVQTISGAAGRARVTVTQPGSGAGTVTSSPPGIDCPGTCSFQFSTTSSVVLTAAAAASSTFSGWTGGGCPAGGNCTIALNDPTFDVMASFALRRYNLTVAPDPSSTGTGTITSGGGEISCGAMCQAQFDHGTMVTLTATPSPNSDFMGWVGGGCTGLQPCAVTLTAATTVNAIFALKRYALTVAKPLAGMGTVAGNGISCGATCTVMLNHGTSVSLTAAASGGSAFTGWGAPCGATSPCAFTLTAPTTVDANFVLMRTLTVTATGMGTLTGPGGINCPGTCSASFPEGSTVTLTAMPMAGYATAWSGDCTAPSGNTCDVVIDATPSVGANFAVGGDLVLTSVACPATVGAGGSLACDLTIQNVGSVATGMFSNLLVLSGDPVIGGPEPVLATCVVPSLAGGAMTTVTCTGTMPAGAIAGPWYVGGVADSGGAVPEMNETNNTGSDLVRVLPNGIDLVVQSVTCNGPGLAGGAVMCTVIHRNAGNVASAATVYDMRLSADLVIDGSDPLLTSSSCALGPVQPEATVTTSCSGTVPAATGAGRYNVGVVTDPANTISETNEANNTGSGPFNVAGVSSRDLLVRSLTCTPTTFTSGASVSCDVVFENIGSLAAVASQFELRLSVGTTIDTSDALITTCNLGALNAGAAATVTCASTITTPLTGLNHIGVRTDSGNAVSESNESNNTFALPVVILGAGIDLVVTGAVCSDPMISGAFQSCSITVQNRGLAASGTSITETRVSSDGTITGSDPLLCASAILGLASGESLTFGCGGTSPPMTAGNTYQVGITADAGAAVTESNESNNLLLVPVFAAANGIDLRALSNSCTPTEGTTGTAVTCTAVVRNQGNTVASASTLQVRLSADTITTPNDPVDDLAASCAVGALAPAQQVTVPCAGTIPGGNNPGAYFLIAVADGAGVLAEASESNNYANDGFDLGPDLDVQTMTCTSPILPSTAVSCTATVRNIGGANMPANSGRLFYSDDSTITSSDAIVQNPCAIPAINANSSAVVTCMGTLPAAAMVGTRYLGLWVDYSVSGDGDEVDETNNIGTDSISVGQDLVAISVTGCSPATMVAKGASISCTLTIRNDGPSMTGSFVNRMYLQNSGSTPPSSNNIATGCAAAGVAAGATTGFTCTGTIPSTPAIGNYQICFVADNSNAVAEFNESNNTLSYSGGNCYPINIF